MFYKAVVNRRENSRHGAPVCKTQTRCENQCLGCYCSENEQRKPSSDSYTNPRLSHFSSKVTGFKDWPDAEIKLSTDCYPLGTRERLAFELLLCAAPRRSDVVRIGPEHISGGRLVYRQKKTGAEIDIQVLPQLRAAIAAMPSLARQKVFLETQFGEAFTETGFYNWFTGKARQKLGSISQGPISGWWFSKACCRRLGRGGMLGSRNHVGEWSRRH